MKLGQREAAIAECFRASRVERDCRIDHFEGLVVPAQTVEHNGEVDFQCGIAWLKPNSLA